MSKADPEATAALLAAAAAIDRLSAITQATLDEQRHQRREREANDPERLAGYEARRRPMRRLSPLAFVMAAPAAYAEMSARVPEEYVAGADTEGLYVTCPCGTEHLVSHEGWPHVAECGRAFVYDGQEMRVSARPES